MKKQRTLVFKIMALVSYLAMITVNFLANALPIAGKNTGQVSDSYPNLFAPAGFTFAIWGVIYLLLASFVVFYLSKKEDNRKVFEKVSKFFIISSLANIAWIFSWHYGLIFVSVILMLVILVSLIKIADIINKEKLNIKEKFFLRLPFSVYFAWITVATIANVTALLVKFSWSGWGLSPVTWLITILIVGAIIGIVRAIKDRNIPYILVFAWAYFGILSKHTSASAFNNQYPGAIKVIIVAIILFILTAIFLFPKKKE